ncbi:GFA family protein [Falsirhodobacter deserti]|uniref:GFA family protein n=1 Tax=Falsirhodobacter deserti TaxID=1365611 RepID=UPI000FE3A2D3|nr:GFA family protein [Falsirhodobacter deserti]
MTTGHCLCGTVRVTLTDAPAEMHACHCEICRRQGLIGFSVQVPEGEISISGDTIRTYASSDWGHRAFCGTCGTNLWFRLNEGGPYFLSPGLLDDMTGLALADEIFIDRKPAGYALAGERPRLTGDEFYKMIASSSEGGQP